MIGSHGRIIRIPSRRWATALSVAFVALLTFGSAACSSSGTSSPTRETFVVTTGTLLSQVDIDLESNGKTVGDQIVFQSPMQDQDGNEGLLIVFSVTVDLPDEPNDVYEDRLGTLLFDFGDDTILASGGNEFSPKQSEMAANKPVTRAVTGGTGRFIGARGEVVTVRNPDFTYVHTFTFLK